LNWKLVLAAVFVCGLLLGGVSFAAVNYLVQIRNVGRIRAIGVQVFADESLTSVLDEIDWGTLNPGENRSVNVWIKNTGNDAQKLIFWTESWDPVTAQNSIALNWNYGDEWIPAGASIPVTFTLCVDPTISDVDSFSFDIWVKGVA
jgi:hypothetical protein